MSMNLLVRRKKRKIWTCFVKRGGKGFSVLRTGAFFIYRTTYWPNLFTVLSYWYPLPYTVLAKNYLSYFVLAAVIDRTRTQIFKKFYQKSKFEYTNLSRSINLSSIHRFQIAWVTSQASLTPAAYILQPELEQTYIWDVVPSSPLQFF